MDCINNYKKNDDCDYIEDDYQRAEIDYERANECNYISDCERVDYNDFYDMFDIFDINEENCYDLLNSFTNEQLNNISFYGKNITGKCLGRFIENKPKILHNIDLQNVKLLKLEYLENPLGNSTNIKNLNLYNNNLEYQLPSLSKIINKNKSIEILNISKTEIFNQITFNQLQDFNKSITNNKTIKTLKMNFIFKNKESVVNSIFDNGFKNNKFIETLELTDNDIIDCEVISKSIKNNNNLKKIDLSNNKITDDSLENLFKELKDRKSKLEIDLKYNNDITHIYFNEIPKYVTLKVNDNINVIY